MKQVFGMVFAMALTAACVPDGATTCDAAGMRHLVGQNITALQTMRFGVEVRILGPDTPATKDFRPDRLNIIYDQTGLIIEVGCY